MNEEKGSNDANNRYCIFIQKLKKNGDGKEMERRKSNNTIISVKCQV